MKKLIVLSTVILLSFTAFATPVVQSNSEKIVDGKQYSTLDTPASPDKEVIEFFSFYCGGCYVMETDYRLPEKIKHNLPKNATMKQYHIDTFGGLSPQLSEAWAIANVLGSTQPVAKALFNAIHSTHTLNSEADIIAIFASLGIPEQQYRSMKNNVAVKAYIKQQQNAFEQLKPSAVPSFYVNGKYKILSHNLMMPTKDSVSQAHSNVINYLIEHGGK